MDLEVWVEGKHGKMSDYSLAFNGLKCSRQDGKDAPESFEDLLDNDHKGQCHGHFKLHKFYLNGAVPFDFMLAGIRKNKGELRLGLMGGDYKVRQAQLVINGTVAQKCPSPLPKSSPSPTPAPIPPTTTLNSVTPNANPTSSLVVSFNFSTDRASNTTLCSIDGAAFVACRSPQSYSSLSNGSHTFKVYSQTSEGLTDQPVSYSWTIDAAPPTVTIDNAGSLRTLTNVASISLQFSSTEQGTFTCSLDGMPELSCTSPAAYQGLADGSHSFSVIGTDLVGNRSQPATFNWTIDTRAPVATITFVDPADSISNVTDKTFQFAANESATFECSIDNGSFNSCTSPLSLSHLSEGGHWFSVQAIDAAGNTGLPASYSWSIDLTAPVITILANSPNEGLTAANHISVDFSVSEPGDTVCSLDTNAFVACTSPYTASVSKEGNHSVTIRAKDAAGNISADTVLQWTMDFTPPFISFGAIQPSASQFINATDLSIQVIASEKSTFTASLDGQAPGLATSPISLTNLSEGAHTLTVNGFDEVGNPSNAIEHDFVVDLTAPTVNLTADDNSSPTRLDSRTFTFTSNEDATFECQLDGAGFSTCASPAGLSGLADGDHTYSVRATDLAGNVGPDSSLSWTVDTRPPTTSLSSTRTGNSITFTLSSSESPATFTCALDSAAVQNCNTTQSYAGLQVGTHTFVAYSKDLAGNTDTTGASYNFAVLPPISTQITSVSVAANITNSRSMTFGFTANQAGATFVCSLNGQTPTACTSPIAYTQLADGNYTFKVQAVDQYGQVDAVGDSHAWTVDTIAPTTSLSVSQQNSSITFTLSASESPVTYTCSLDGAAFAACTSPKAYTGVAAGNHTFTAKAKDQAGNTDATGASSNFTVLPPITTQITSISVSAAVTQNHDITYGFTANQPNATFICTLNSQPATSCTSPIDYLDLPDGNYTFKVQAIDQWGSVDPVGATHAWTIDSTPPTILSTSITATSTTITINWTTNEASTSRVLWGRAPAFDRDSGEITTLVTSHSIRLSGLTPGTSYIVQTTGKDKAGNVYTGTKRTVQTSN